MYIKYACSVNWNVIFIQSSIKNLLLFGGSFQNFVFQLHSYQHSRTLSRCFLFRRQNQFCCIFRKRKKKLIEIVKRNNFIKTLNWDCMSTSASASTYILVERWYPVTHYCCYSTVLLKVLPTTTSATISSSIISHPIKML